MERSDAELDKDIEALIDSEAAFKMFNTSLDKMAGGLKEAYLISVQTAVLASSSKTQEIETPTFRHVVWTPPDEILMLAHRGVGKSSILASCLNSAAERCPELRKELNARALERIRSMTGPEYVDLDDEGKEILPDLRYLFSEDGTEPK